MMKTEVYNQNAAAAALRVLGGQQLVEAFAQLYSVIAIAERAGYEGGFEAGSTNQAEANNDGYDTGYADGYSDGINVDPTEDAIEEFNSEDVSVKVKTNAQVEGFKFLNEDHMHDWELAKAVAALG